MLACIPEGNPAPALVCVWNGMIIDLDVPQKATQNLTGTYCCTATNQLGSASKDIAVVVQGIAAPATRPRVGRHLRDLRFLHKHGGKREVPERKRD